MYNNEGRTRSTRRNNAVQVGRGGKQFQGATLLSDDTDLLSNVLTPPATQHSGSPMKTRRWRGYDTDPIDYDQPPPTPTPSIPPPSPATFSPATPSPIKRKADYDHDNFDQPPPTPKRTRRFLNDGLLSKRSSDDHLDQPPDTPSSSYTPSNKRNRYGDDFIGNRYGASSSSMYANVSSTSSDTPLSATSFHLDDMSLPNISFDMDQPTWGGLNSANDPFLADKRRELHTPSPPLSPNMDMTTPLLPVRPETPTPRPETPGMSSPLTPAMETGIVGEIVDDDHNSDVVAVTSLSLYGPPPTPMCPPRVGNILSPSIISISTTSSSLSIQNISSALISRRSSSVTTPPTTTSALPPSNILESDDDDDDDEEIQEQSMHTNTHPSPPNKCSHNKSNTKPVNTNHNTFAEGKSCTDSFSQSANSPDIISGGSRSGSSTSRSNSQSDNNVSPRASPPPASLFIPNNYLHKLRIIAPCSSKKSGKKSGRVSGRRPSGESDHGSTPCTSHSIKSILKCSSSNTGTSVRKRVGSVVLKFNVLKESEKESSGASKDNMSSHKEPVEFLKPDPPKRPVASFSPSSRIGPGESSKRHSSMDDRVVVPGVGGRSQPFSNAMYPHENIRNRSNNRDGIILELRLKQIMIHKLLHQTLKPGVNVITGANGTGKSAHTNGVKLLFGGKASSTARATSVQRLIKEGCDYAEVEAHFTNYNGTLNKKHFGETVQLKRKFTQSGASTYSITDANGKWRVIKVNELKTIRDKLHIDPSNPFQFLQQVGERQTENKGGGNKQGSSNNATQDFWNFNRATKLADLKEMLENSKENVVATRTIVEDTMAKRKLLLLEHEQLNRDMANNRKFEEKEKGLAYLQAQLLWAEVQELEEEHDAIKKTKNELFQESSKLKALKKEKDDEVNSMRGKKSTDTKLLTDVRVQIQSLEQTRETKDMALKEAKRTQKRNQTQQRSLTKSIMEINNVIRKLETEQTKETVSYEEENQKHRAEIQHYEGVIAEKNVVLEKLRVERDTLQTQVHEIQAEEQKARNEVDQLEKQMKETKKELNKKNNFGRHMATLLEKIDRYTRWKIKPVGPLGQHILVPDPKYAPLIEQILYPALFTFVVFTKEDMDALKALIGEVYSDKEKSKTKVRDPAIIQLCPHDLDEFTRRLKTVKDKLTGFTTVLSCAAVSEPTVERGLVEKTMCERLILFDNNQSAAKTMKDNRNVPSEVQLGYTLDWFKVSPFPRYQFQPFGGKKYKTDILPMAKGDASGELQEVINKKQETIKICLTHLKGKNGLKDQLSRKDAEISQIIKQIKQLESQIKHARGCIRVESASNSDNRDVADAIKVEMDLRQRHENEIQVLQKELDLANEEVIGLTEEIGKIDAKLTEMRMKMEQLEGDETSHSKYVRKLQSEAEQFGKEMKRLDKEMKTLSEKENTVFYNLEKKLKKASLAGERPQKVDSVENVRRQMETDQHYIDENQDKYRKEKRKLIAKLEYNTAKIEEMSREIRLFQEFDDYYEPLLKTARICYEDRKDAFTKQLKDNYRTLVEGHGEYTGGCIVDWEEERIYAWVCADEEAEIKVNGILAIENKKDRYEALFKYVCGLSGGERGKAIVFLMMSMWENMDAPFFIIDEFESMMDPQVRSYIIDKLFVYAETNPDRQLVIMTPLDVRHIEDNYPKTNIIRLTKVDERIVPQVSSGTKANKRR